MSVLLAIALSSCTVPPELAELRVEPLRDYQVADLPVELEIRAVDSAGKTLKDFDCPVEARGLSRVSGQRRSPVVRTAPLSGGQLQLHDVAPEREVELKAGPVTSSWHPELRRLPGVVAVLPPLLAVATAILFKNALVALFSGLWLGALFVHGLNPLWATLRTIDTHLPEAVATPSRVSVMMFTIMLGGLIGVLARSGSTRALIDRISSRARGRRAALLTTWGAGLAVFFDDYANCLLVGSTLRPFTDRLKISREKLAYLIDSTAAPVATVALVSTWIGYQLGLLEDLVADESLGVGETAYELFLASIPYSFYSLLTIWFVFLICMSGRDFGPMLAAERRAVRRGELLRPGAQPMAGRELDDLEPNPGQRTSPWPALFVVLCLLVFVAGGLLLSGSQRAEPGANLQALISSADSYAVLSWSSFGGSLAAIGACLWTRSLSFSEAMDAWMNGAKAMVIATFILVLAWGLGTMCKDFLQTGPWILSQVNPSPHWLPVMTFLACAAVAFATGSSFSTMAIVVPIAGPMAWLLTGYDAGLEPDVARSIRLGTLAAILSGSVFGDHCSPISDTTILSSMGAASDHIDHVRTQIPYALTCAAVAALVGFVPAGFGWGPAWSLAVGAVGLAALVFGLGQEVA